MQKRKYIESRRWTVLIALFIVHCSLFISVAQAQPKQRRNQQPTQAQQKSQSGNQGGMTQRARLMYPVAADMPEDVVWQRDIYREVDLNQGANAGLYYPLQPKGKQMNLFTYIFKLAQNGYIPIYEYSPTESEERFEESAKRPFKDMLDDQGIFYEEKEGKVVIDNCDIPSEEVRRYFLKESAYYDQTTSTFHRKVIALCPVRMSAFPANPDENGSSGDDGGDDGDDFSFGGGDFGDEPHRPMFWIKYSDLEPFLNRQSIIINDNNIAATVTMEDFFTLNKYTGKIYKVTNMLGRNLADYCKTDSALAKEQARIEAELESFRKNIFGNPEEKDSLNAANEAADTKKAKAEKASRSSEPKAKTEKVKRTKTSSPKSSGGGSARVSVRRERH